MSGSGGTGTARRRRRGWRSSLLAGLALAVGLAAPAAAQFLTDSGTVLNTIQTSTWVPPSPDPSGILYRADIGKLVTCDAEVEETVLGITLYQGVNVWTHTTAGVVTSTFTTVGHSNEPTGVTFDPTTETIWFSDDVRGSIHQFQLGPDHELGTADDVITEIRDVDSTGCDDLEDLTFNNFDGHLYIASGGSQEICELEPGPNGIFDSLPPRGDDVISSIWSTLPNVLDPEGIVFDPFSGTNGTLVVADRSTRDLYEFTPEGGFLRKIDVNFPSGVKPAGVAIAPGTTNPMLRNYYVVDRRVDNDTDPNENDGRLFEIVAVPLGGNGPPIVDAGSPQTIQWPANSVNLNGFVNDDGHPYPPSTVTAVWSKQSGPGSVSFGNATQAVTTASFSAPGIYVLQLVGNDSALQTLDTVSITVSSNVTLSVSTTGPGAVSLSPPGGTYSFGQNVTVTAVPNSGAALTGWSGALSGTTNPQVVVMDANKSVTASFATLVNLAVTVNGPGSVNLSPPGGSYLPGTQVTLTAVPGPSAVLTSWGGALSGETNPQQLTVNGNTSVSATFTQLYDVSTAAVGPGSVTVSPPNGPYASGTNLTVTATPNADAVFLGWSGHLSGTTTPTNLLVDGDKSVTGTFATLYDVAVSATGPGSVTLEPPGGTYPAGTNVTVTATADAGAVFLGFGGALTGTATPQIVTVDADKTISAGFAAQYTLGVSASGPGTVTLDPPGGVYAAGTSVTVEAVPDADSAFVGWSGALTGATNPQVVVVNADASATASFATLYDVAVTTTGPGSVALDPPGGTYPAGTSVSVSASPDPGAEFLGFGGDLAGTTTPQPLIVDADKTVSADFLQHYQLDVTTTGSGSVALSPPGGVYEAGTLVTLTAQPAGGWLFGSWSGDASGSQNPIQLTMSDDLVVQARFRQPTSCGIGPELVALLPPLGWLLRRRRLRG